MRTVLLVCALAFVAVLARTELETQQLFLDWIDTYGKSYTPSDFQVRYAIWKQKLAFVEDHNSKGLSFTVKTNKFADLSNKEFVKLYTGLRMPQKPTNAPTVKLEYPTDPLPDNFNWNDHNAVSYVKDQGQCGSCWAFSTTGSIEGCNRIKFPQKDENLTLSEQQIVDCSNAFGNMGCDGGLMSAAMDYVIKNGGLNSEDAYPYFSGDSGDQGNCQFDPSKVVATITSYYNISSGNETDLLYAAAKGPVSVAIDASSDAFQSYDGGVYYQGGCSTTDLDHGVLVVGWGLDKGWFHTESRYWIVKNSWGSDWGMDGYIWMAKDAQNMCGIATMASIPFC